MSELIATGNALGLGYKIYERTGTVCGSEHDSVTTGTTRYEGNQRISESVTVNYHILYLKDKEGVEHSCQLRNISLPAREGHKVSVYLLISGNKKLGYYFRAYNHNTRDMVKSGETVRDVMYPWIICWGLVAAYVIGMVYSGMNTPGNSTSETVMATLLIGIPVCFAVWLFGKIIAFLRGMMVSGNGKFRRHMKTLTSH